MTASPNTALHYSGGAWSRGPDPVMDEWHRLGADTKTSESDLMRSLGYEELFAVGDRYSSGFTAWRLTDGRRYVLAVGEEHLTEYHYFEALPDLYDTCTRWAALARDAAITEFIRELNRDPKFIRDDFDLVGALTERVTRAL